MKTFRAHTPLLELHEALPLIEAELERARRYRRPLSLVVMRDADVRLLSVRAPDILVGIDRNRVMVVAPETGRADAHVLAERLGALAEADVAGVACFPDDGPGLEALLIAAEATAPAGTGARMLP